MSVDSSLQKLNITLPAVAAPAAAYVPFTRSGGHIYISGQLPFVDGNLSHTGHLGRNVTVSEGQDAARDCALNVIAVLKSACDGDLDRVSRILRLEILVSSDASFTEQHLVANGASNLIKDVFGADIGSHARAAYGTSSLPLNAAVEIAAIAEII